MKETRRKEILRPPFSNIAIIGMGQTGRFYAQELGSIPETELYGLSRNYRQEGIESKYQVGNNGQEVLERQPDLLILATTNPTDQALEDIIAQDHKDMTVVLPQNGVEVVGKALSVFGFSQTRLVRASLFTSVNTGNDGDLIYDTQKRRIAFADVQRKSKEAQRVATLFESVGFKVHVSEDFRRMEWTKLLANLIGSTAAVTGLTPQETFSHPDVFALEVEGLRSRIKIMKKAVGIGFENFPWFSRSHVVASTLLPSHLPEFARKILAQQISSERSNQRPAAWRKRQEGKPTEMQQYHYPFIEQGGKKGIRSPVDEAILFLHELDRAGEISLNTMEENERVGLLLEQHEIRSKDE